MRINWMILTAMSDTALILQMNYGFSGMELRTMPAISLETVNGFK